MRTTERKQQHHVLVLLLFTATYSVSGDKANNTARQLLKDTEMQSPVCLYLSHRALNVCFLVRSGAD